MCYIFKQQSYSADLASVIRTMLRLNFKQRPTAIELIELPYIKDCLALSSSPLVDSKKKDLTDVNKRESQSLFFFSSVRQLYVCLFPGRLALSYVKLIHVPT